MNIKSVLILVLMQIFICGCNDKKEDEEALNNELKIMTFNVQRSDLYGWNDPTWEYEKSRGEKVADAIVLADADIIGLQEYMHNDPESGLDADWMKKKLEKKTGTTWYYSKAGTGILSKYPVSGTTESGKGVFIDLPGFGKIVVYSTHIGLQPDWQRYYIPYSAAMTRNEQFLYSETEIIRRARLNWDTIESSETGIAQFTGPMKLVAEIKKHIENKQPVFLMGDFNEVSHYDWTQKATDAGIVPRKIEAPFSKLLTGEIGMLDSYHQDRLNKGKDEVTRRGFTWTPFADKNNYTQDDDRIDFIYFNSDKMEVYNSQVIGENSGLGVDIELTGKFPSDHRAVVSSFRFLN